MEADSCRLQINRVNRADLEANSVRLPPDAGVFTREVGALAKAYFGAIDEGDTESMVGHLDPNGFNIHVLSPDATLTSENDYREWYRRIVSAFSRLHHTVVALNPKLVTANSAQARLSIHSEVDRRNPAPDESLWDPQAAENWGYTTVPQPGLNGRAIDIARGKVLGGCSAVNAMMHVRGNRRCFDAWAELGNKGWSYEEVLPYFKKSETYHGPISSYHGDNGPVSVIDVRNPTPILHAFVEAAATLGAKHKYNDFNGATQEGGAGFYHSTRTPDGIRVTAGSAFIKPILGLVEEFSLRDPGFCLIV